MTRIPVALVGSCNDCGKCCEPVMLAQTQTEVRVALPGTVNERDRAFILNDLTQLPYKVGLELRSDLKGRALSASPNGTDLIDREAIARPVFYSCRHYDTVNRRCTNYDDRPPLCRGYPWYGNEAQPHAALPPECGYNVDIGKPVVP